MIRIIACGFTTFCYPTKLFGVRYVTPSNFLLYTIKGTITPHKILWFVNITFNILLYEIHSDVDHFCDDNMMTNDISSTEECNIRSEELQNGELVPCFIETIFTSSKKRWTQYRHMEPVRIWKNAEADKADQLLPTEETLSPSQEIPKLNQKLITYRKGIKTALRRREEYRSPYQTQQLCKDRKYRYYEQYC